MMNAEAAYREMTGRAREIALLASSAHVLGWDRETYLPRKAVGYRAEQLAYLSGRIHRLATAVEVGEWLAACEDAGFGEGSVEASNVREWRRDYERATRLSAEFVEEFERARTLATKAWEEARRDSDFAAFAPHLERIVEMSRRKADLWGYGGSRYDALLEEYERGATAAEVGRLFDALKPELAAIAKEAEERSRAVPADLLAGHYPTEDQARLNRRVAEAFGFDFEAGRIDTAAHPFCSGVAPGDTRMTTRYDEADFTSSLYGVLHECGHGLYDQGLPESDFGLPSGEAVSLGIHESQSRLWENHIGRSPAFWECWHPFVAEVFPSLRRLGPEQLAAAAVRSQPSHIRVEADEATYDLHIILRFEIERLLIEGVLAPRDVPAAWNERFEALLGIPVERDADGCLQDIHWSFGLLGYFPTYTLGNLCAAQLHRAALQAVDGLEGSLARGEYRPLLDWLRANVHRHGRTLLPSEIMAAATGRPMEAEHHLAHLRRRYAGGS